MARASAAEWAKRVERWKDSGLTTKEFAAEMGLKASTLTYWKWKLGNDERDKGADSASRTSRRAGRTGPGAGESVAATGRTGVRARRAKRTRKSTKKVMAKGAFVEVATVATVAAPLEVVLAGGTCVRVPEGFDEETLTRVVRAMEAVR